MVGTKWDVWSPMLKALRCFPPLGSMKDSFNFSENPPFYLNCLSGCGTKCSGFSPQLGHCPATDPGAGPMQLEGLGEHTVHSGSNPLRGSFHQKGTKESKKRWGSTVFCCTFPLSLTRSWSFFFKPKWNWVPATQKGSGMQLWFHDRMFPKKHVGTQSRLPGHHSPPQLSRQTGPHGFLWSNGQCQDCTAKEKHCHLEARLRQLSDLGVDKKTFFLCLT